MAEAVQIESLLVSPPEASAITGIGARKIREAVAAGKIKAVLVGTHTKIFRASLLAWLDALPSYCKQDYSRRLRKQRGRR
jgi:excisionase family DNA binding protein